MKRVAIVLLVLVAVIWGAVAWVLFSSAVPAPAKSKLEFSGTLEARQVALVTEVAGQILNISVREGDAVAAGKVLIELDPAMQDAQIARAAAAVEAAKASLGQVKAGARPEAVDRARAALERELAARDGAERGVRNLEGILDNPQELDAQIALTRAQLSAAEASITKAQNERRAALVVRDRYQGDSSPEGRAQFQAGDAGVRAGDAAITAAEADRDGVKTALDLLLGMRANPLSLRSQLHAAEAQLNQAEALVLMARAELDGLLAGPRAEEVAIAQAQVDLAQAGLEQLQVMRDKMTLRAPIAGMVTALSVRGGENIQPGSKLLTLANLDDIHLSIYVPESQVGRVRVGQSVNVTVDGLPGKVTVGKIYFISPRAEYTPASVQTKEERAKTVFLVKVQLANPDRALKPGMPADAVVLE